MNRVWRSQPRTMIPGHRFVHCKVATTTSGTLAATQTNWGLKLTKTATKTGRYTCQLVKADGSNDNAVAFVQAIVSLIGADDTAYPTGKGVWTGIVRADDIGKNNNDGTIEIQFVEPETAAADAEVADGAIINVTLYLRDSNAP